jgi:proteasome regulatory subunit
MRTMPLDKRVDMEIIYGLSQDISGAEIKAVVTEAGYFAIRENRDAVLEADFVQAIAKVRRDEDKYGKDYVNMFG